MRVGMMTAIQPSVLTLGAIMPVVSAFHGIVVRMFFNEHQPPHFHAEHQGDRGAFDFDGRLIAGEIRSASARGEIAEWARLYGRELEANWARARAGVPLERIPPLR